MKRTAIRGPLLTFKGDPYQQPESECVHYESDAVIVMENGLIREVGPAPTVLKTLTNEVPVTLYPNDLIIPGFIDCHVHYPQTEIVASHGKQLIDWLRKYTFVSEQHFDDAQHAAEVAEVFISEQVRNGITSSTIFCTIFPESVDAIFEEAARINMRVMAGKVCMDRNAPEGLLDTPQRAYDESKALIERWHGKGRAEYVITPRFAPTSTEAQLDMLGALAREYPDMLIQSHLSENLEEIAWVHTLFPDDDNYTAIYDRFGLLRERAIYGHGVHLSEEELCRFNEAGAAIAHCPTSNFFLGSGYLNVQRAKAASRPVRVGIATDIGGGTSFSILQTLNEAYKAAHLHGTDLTAAGAFYLATRGTAEALGLADRIGSIEPGMEADLAVLNLRSTPLIDYRMRYAETLDEILFLQMIMGDDRAIAATYVAGDRVYAASHPTP